MVRQDELQEHMLARGYTRDELAEKIFKTVDFDESGSIDVAEFRKAYITYPSMRSQKLL